MNAPVYVVNTGVISAIGSNTDTCLDSLLAEKSGIGKAKYLESHWVDDIPVGEVKAANADLAALYNAPESWPRTALLSLAAATECWSPFMHRIQPSRVGFFSASTVGGMDITEHLFREIIRTNSAGGVADFRYHECGAVTNLVANHLGFSKYITTVSTACSSSANSIMLAAQMIQSGMIDIAVAGGADGLCRFTLNGFNSLGILDNEPCRPMDATRKGLNLGEGAAYVLLMSESAIREFGTVPICTVSGWSNTNDAYHQTASSPEGRGNVLAMEQALQKAGLSPIDISYINLHGTGTENNDSSEGKAIEQVFGESVPPSSSTKSYTGHTLGGAGGVEAVFSALAIREGILIPNLRWQEQMPEVSFEPIRSVERRPVRHVLSNSFGFGGACSSLIFSAC